MESLDSLVVSMSHWFPAGSMYSETWSIYGSLALVLISLVCGGMGGLVVGNRMAFFSDALAHCAFAGVSLGLIFCLLADVSEDNVRQSITLIMVAFGIVVGAAIAWVRDRTGLASDTVIGVFFAFSLGVGAIFTKIFAQQRRLFNIESFMFGSLTGVQAIDIVLLLGVLAVAFAFLYWCYNDMVLTSVNASLAMSRRVPVRLLRYAFIILLGIVINVCLQIVGILLINGLLIVPAAAAANLSRNMRQHFWLTIGITLVCALGGQVVSWELDTRKNIALSTGGVILVLACLVFFASMVLGPVLKKRTA